MYTDFNIKNDNGSSALELDGSGNGTFTLLDIDRTTERTYVQVSYYTDSVETTRVAATGGTVQVVGAMDNKLIWKTIPSGSFDAADTYNEDTTMPSASGPMSNVQVRFTGVVGNGITHARVFLVRY